MDRLTATYDKLGASLVRQTEDANTPCGSCNLCCRKESIVFLLPEEDASQWETQSYEGYPMLILKKQPNGDCYYLDREKGCTIHGNAPLICKKYDCAGAVKLYGFHEAKKHMSRAIRKRGHELLKSGYQPITPPEGRII